MIKISTVAKAGLLALPLFALPALKPAHAAISVPTASMATQTTGAVQDVQYWHRHRYWRHRRWCRHHGCW